MIADVIAEGLVVVFYQRSLHARVVLTNKYTGEAAISVCLSTTGILNYLGRIAWMDHLNSILDAKGSRM